MSKIHHYLGLILSVSMLLAGCESSDLETGRTNGSTGGTGSDQAPLRTGKPDTMTNANNSPQTPNVPQVTITPQASLSHSPWSAGKKDTADWSIHQDSVYHYQIAYPPQFTFKDWESAELAAMRPEPVAGIKYIDLSTNPGGISSSYLTIRIYDMGADTSVEAWLKANGLYLPEDGWTIENYQGEHFSGYQVNSSLYKAPGVFYYASKGKTLYQLTPLGQEAEQMLTTFEFIP